MKFCVCAWGEMGWGGGGVGRRSGPFKEDKRGISPLLSFHIMEDYQTAAGSLEQLCLYRPASRLPTFSSFTPASAAHCVNRLTAILRLTPTPKVSAPLRHSYCAREYARARACERSGGGALAPATQPPPPASQTPDLVMASAPHLWKGRTAGSRGKGAPPSTSSMKDVERSRLRAEVEAKGPRPPGSPSSGPAHGARRRQRHGCFIWFGEARIEQGSAGAVLRGDACGALAACHTATQPALAEQHAHPPTHPGPTLTLQQLPEQQCVQAAQQAH